MLDKTKNCLDNNEKFRKNLYNYGFLFTDYELDTSVYPFYDGWNSVELFDKKLYVSSSQKFTVKKVDQDTYVVIVGHCMNPFNGLKSEADIIDYVSEELLSGEFDKFNELTGVFTVFILKNDSIRVIGDACGMQTVYYGIIEDRIFISSHDGIVGDVLSLETDKYVKKLIGYKLFYLFGQSLPGDLSRFGELKRLIPNHYLQITNGESAVRRFYFPHTQDIGEDEIVDRVSSLLSTTLELISQKWDAPAISLSGGCDSKTTLACAVNNYDKFSYFSFISSDTEKVDAVAAHKICDGLKLSHRIFEIPREDEKIPDIDIYGDILRSNTGNLAPMHGNEIRKRAYFAKQDFFDVEVKSWVNEVGRAYYSKRFGGRKDFGKITPRKCTTLYKVFTYNRIITKQTDKVFKKYIEKYFLQAAHAAIPWQEQFFWEFRMSSWNGSVITGEHRLSYDITIPYNNRLLLELLLSVPIEARINDVIYKKIRDKMNPVIDELSETVVNVKHTKMRARIENLYYCINNILPF